MTKRARPAGAPRAQPEPRDSAEAERRLAEFIDKFEPGTAALIRECRAELRKILPTAFELVYDNYNFFVIGYSATEKPSDCIVSLAAAANGVGLSFYRGADVADPERLLLGSGKQNRFIRLPDAGLLRSRPVLALIQSAIDVSRAPLQATGDGHVVVRSVSGKQRPRRSRE